MIIRAVDGGGAGFRRADIEGVEVKKLKTTEGPVSDPDSLMAFVKQDIHPETDGIAYAVAGVIENHNLVVESPNVHFLDGVYLADVTAKETEIKSAVFNDMEAAVTGMAHLLPDEPYFLGITWSSGIGLRVWNNDKILSVAEGGHMVLDPSPFAPLCGCGKRGHAEAIIGGHAIRCRVIAETEALGIKLPEGEPCQFLDEAYVEGEKWAVDLYQMIGRGMGIFLANIQSLLHLPLIVWKGTFTLKTLQELEPIIRETMKNILIDPTWAQEDNLRFQLSPEPDQDSLIGAANILRSLKI